MEENVSTQKSYLNNIRKDKKQIEIFFNDGTKLIGYIQGFDEFTLTLVVKKEIHLIYKHAIKYIKIYNRQDF